MSKIERVILASQSPRRVALLKQMGLDCLVMPADIDETAYVNELPADYVLRLAEQKALATLKKLNGQHADLPVLAADTTVALGMEILGKPDNDADAVNMLKKLSGNTHEVHTAVAVAFNGRLDKVLNTTLVQMMPLTDAMIAAYIATGEHRDKAGSYAIQGLAGNWIKRIEGSYTGVMGLPVHETAMLLDGICRIKKDYS
ncbi:MAG TPA: Maf family protein [Methylotenera sp.]|nr:Maf family protein [Methylotenera sp.]HPV44082.1 Maf family protein [Methylotenera sp.]